MWEKVQVTKIRRDKGNIARDVANVKQTNNLRGLWTILSQKLENVNKIN